MSAVQLEEHASEQREDQATLLRSLLGFVKLIGGALAVLFIGGIGVLVADHYKLSYVSELVTKLNTGMEESAKAERARIGADAAWRANIDVSILSHKAEMLAITNRMALLESEFRAMQSNQNRKTTP